MSSDEPGRSDLEPKAFLPPHPLGVTEHTDIVLTPVQHDAAAEAQTRLGAFASDGSFLEGFRLVRDSVASERDQRPLSTDAHISETCVYGGVLQLHYGHFLLEGLARGWFLVERRDLPILWHSFNGRRNLLPWHREVLALLGIPEGRLRFVTGPLQAARVLLPDAGFVVNRWLDPEHARLLGVFPFADSPRAGHRVWLSRSRLREGIARVDGEADMEASLAAAGWTIMHPESLPVWQQLAVMAHAEQIAGFEGSAFHTLLLARDVRARITLWRRDMAALPVAHEMLAVAKGLRQAVDSFPLRMLDGGEGRRRSAAIENPTKAAQAVDPACRSSPIPVPRLASMEATRPTRDCLAFVHVAKTAGTALTSVLTTRWTRARIVGTQSAFDAITTEEFESLDLVAGHFYACRLERRAVPGFHALTVLRDPFERLFSSYRFGRQFALAGARVGPAMHAAGEMDFVTWCHESPAAITHRHAQLYQLGLDIGDNAQRISLAMLLEQAKLRLDRMMVGTVDSLDEFVAFIFRRFGHEVPPPAPRAMVSERYDPEEAGLTTAEKQALLDDLRPDFELFHHARRIVERRMEAASR